MAGISAAQRAVGVLYGAMFEEVNSGGVRCVSLEATARGGSGAGPEGAIDRRLPEPLWWLFGSVVTFYFGARELNYMRAAKAPTPQQVRKIVQNTEEIRALRSDSVRIAADDTELEPGRGRARRSLAAIGP